MATTVYSTGHKYILRELDCGIFAPNASLSNLTASSVTLSNWFLDPVMSPDFLQVRNAGFYRGGSATAADNWRPCGTVTISTGAIAQSGAVWADTTLGAEDFEIWYYRVRPDQEILDSLNRVLIKEFVTTYLAVSHLSGLDGDDVLVGTTNFNSVGTSTLSKITTAAMTPWGIKSLRTLNSVANSGARSANIRVKQSGLVNAFTISSSEVGTSSLQAFDGTNSVAFGTAVTTSERRPQLMTLINAQVPATCKVAGTYMTNSATLGDTTWNQQWLYNLDNPVCPLPALVTESFMAPKILMGVPRYSTTTNVYDAEGLDWITLIEGVDYWLIINQADAQPYKVRFAETWRSRWRGIGIGSYYNYPLVVEARVPQSSLLTVAAETDAFWDLNKVIPRWKKNLLETVYNVGARRLPDWTAQYNLAKEQLLEASKARQKTSVASAVPYYAPRASAS